MTRSNSKNLATLILATICLFVHTATGFSGQAKAEFRFNEEQIKLIDSMAYLQDEGDPAKPITVVVFTDFALDHQAVVDEIDPLTGLYDQTMLNKGNTVILSLVSQEQGGISAFLSETSQRRKQRLGLGFDFPVKMETIDTSRVAGVCFTNQPKKMFDDTYEFRLSFDLPVTPTAKPSLLGPGGGEPGKALQALFRSIPAKNWDVASLHLPKDFLPSEKPEQLNSFFQGLEINFPSEATITEGQIKGNRARLKITGKDHEGKKIKGRFDLKEEQEGWRIKNFGLFFDRN